MSEDQRLKDALADARKETIRKHKEFLRNTSQEQLDEYAARIQPVVKVVKSGQS